MKHALLVRLVRALQKKETGFLYLDTHAGRGRYDLRQAASGDTHARRAESPDGIGRLWTREDLPAEHAEYLAQVRRFDADRGNPEPTPRFYPGSPWLARLLARPQDRLALCEKQPDECEELRLQLSREPKISIHELDGYVALRAMLPPPERRGLVLIDPPFEAQDEFAQIADALGEGLRRFASGVYAVWYPLTERARVNEFFAAIRDLRPPRTLAVELAIAGEYAPIKMKGCGLLVINPPWQFDREAEALVKFLAPVLAQAPGASGRVDWVVSE